MKVTPDNHTGSSAKKNSGTVKRTCEDTAPTYQRNLKPMQTVFTPSAQTNFIYFKGDIDNALSTFLQLQNREKGTNCCSSVHGSNTSLYWPRSLQKYKGGAST